MVGLRQPVAKNEPVQRTQNQPLGATCSAGHYTDVVWLQTVADDVLHGFGASIDSESLHKNINILLCIRELLTHILIWLRRILVS